MFGRGFLFLAVLVAAVAIPYFAVNDGDAPGTGLARLWDSMFQNGDQAPRYGSPIPSASPIPPRGNAIPTRGNTVRRGPVWTPQPSAVTGVPTGTSPVPTTFPQTPALPPGATATPWMPVDGSAPMGSTAPSAAYPGIVQGGAATVPGAASPTSEADHTGIGPRVQNLGDLFRFDITPEWVVQNWPRVTSDLAEFAYTGLRVLVVSGTEIDDLAGAITYYFDDQQQLQRITFLGTTGNPTELIQLATSRFKMQPEAALSGVCYVARSRKTITDMLRVRHVAVAKGNRPLQRYKIAMEVNRSGNSQGLSAINARMLEQEHKIIEANAESSDR